MEETLSWIQVDLAMVSIVAMSSNDVVKQDNDNLKGHIDGKVL